MKVGHTIPIICIIYRLSRKICHHKSKHITTETLEDLKFCAFTLLQYETVYALLYLALAPGVNPNSDIVTENNI